MKTSEKLRALAAAIRRSRRFNIGDYMHCIVGTGLRFRPETGDFDRRRAGSPGAETMKSDFANKYGLPYLVVRGLWIGNYRTIDVNESMVDWSSTPIKQAQQAAALLERVANDFERVRQV